MAKSADSQQFVNFYEVAGGDGLPANDAGAPADPILANTPSDASADDAALDAHIAQITGLPIAKTEVKNDDQAATGAGAAGTDGQNSGGDDNGAGADAGVSGSGANDGGNSGRGAEGAQGGGQGDAGAGTGDQGAQQTKPQVEEKPVDKPVEMPEIKPENYALEVEDANGNKLTINSLDDLPDDFAPKSNKQALQILDDLRELQTKRKADEEAAAVAANDKRVHEEEAAINKGWMTEIEALQADGRIEKPKIAEGQPGFLDDPAIQRMDSVFKFMIKENTERAKKGIAPIRSFTDALTHLELQEAREAKITADKASQDTAKRKAGLINGAGSGTNSAGTVDRPYIAGQASDIFDALRR